MQFEGLHCPCLHAAINSGERGVDSKLKVQFSLDIKNITYCLRTMLRVDSSLVSQLFLIPGLTTLSKMRKQRLKDALV